MNYGFIGLGNMASAIIAGMTSSDDFKGSKIFGINRSPAKTEKLAAEYGVIPCDSIMELMENSDTVILAVKPQVLPEIMDGVQTFSHGKLIVTIAAGKTLEWYEKRLPDNTPVIRVMPNINAAVHKSVTAVCGNSCTLESHITEAEKIFSAVGKVYRIEEKLFPAFSAVCGASGAFVHLYIDALSESAVRYGIPRFLAEELAAETVLGSAMLKEISGEHPIILMNKVCSPGGTTVEGVVKLKELGFETAIQQAITAVIEKDIKL